MQKELVMLSERALKELSQASGSAELQTIQKSYLGKKGLIQALMKKLSSLPREERPAFGKTLNEHKQKLLAFIHEKAQSFQEEEEKKQISTENLDISLPGRRLPLPSQHPITQEMDEVLDLLSSMGFSIQLSPEIEDDFHNFTALNFPEEHPARDMQDSFYLNPQFLLRTHTSNAQIRVMENEKPPFRIAAPGRCFRNEDVSARSHVLFHQVEALYVSKDTSLADLLANLEDFIQRIFPHQEVQTRIRPSFFPFVEPGLELDISCTNCQAKGCKLCKSSGWLEILGAGMVHPSVLKGMNIDPEIYSAYAWGLGIERLVMLKRGVHDIRLFTENRFDFLRQFA